MNTQEIRSTVERMGDELVALRRDFHQYPELAYQEHRTSEVIVDYLRRLGVEARTGYAETGVLGIIRGERPGKTLLIRADIDALPIEEVATHSYRSRNPGRMHACGHDGHAAVALGVAKVLQEHRSQLNGTAVIMFQPAEEAVDGAPKMIADGALDDPRPDAAIAMHLWNYLPIGQTGIRPGAIFASADEWELVIRGKGGHGAIPQTTVDPIVTAADVIMSLQTLVSREVSPFVPAVVTVGTIHGGTAFNIIADEVRMRGTSRALDAELRGFLLDRIRETAERVASAHRATAELRHICGAPPVVNDPAIASLVERVAARVLGEGSNRPDAQSMGGDDVAFVLERVPGCYFLVGSANAEKGLDKPHHNCEFDFDERALLIGAEILLGAAFDYLS